MTFWLTLFIGSGSALILFFLVKIIQDKYRMLLFWPDARSRLEKYLLHKRAELRVYQETKGRSLAGQLWLVATNPVRRMAQRLMARLSRTRLVRTVRGEQDIESQEKGSYFLNNIGSFRDRFRR